MTKSSSTSGNQSEANQFSRAYEFKGVAERSQAIYKKVYLRSGKGNSDSSQTTQDERFLWLDREASKKDEQNPPTDKHGDTLSRKTSWGDGENILRNSWSWKASMGSGQLRIHTTDNLYIPVAIAIPEAELVLDINTAKNQGGNLFHPSLFMVYYLFGVFLS